MFSAYQALAESEDYPHAYQSLVDEVNAPVNRNALTEDEAEKLSKFNAELLNHKNPAQKIMYVDRIRQELADAKQVCSSKLSGSFWSSLLRLLANFARDEGTGQRFGVQ